MLGFKGLKNFWTDDECEACDGFNYSAFVNMGGGGGKGGGGAPAPVFVPPPAAPAVTGAATLEMSKTPEEEARRKREATKQGAKSLQIPVSGEGGTEATVGTTTA